MKQRGNQEATRHKQNRYSRCKTNKSSHAESEAKVCWQTVIVKQRKQIIMDRQKYTKREKTQSKEHKHGK